MSLSDGAPALWGRIIKGLDWFSRTSRGTLEVVLENRQRTERKIDGYCCISTCHLVALGHRGGGCNSSVFYFNVCWN